MTLGEGQTGSSDMEVEACREVVVSNKQGLHARPVMAFVDRASQSRSRVTVANITRKGETVDGKSAMQMMILEATQGCVLRIGAKGVDARETVDALAALVEAGFKTDSPQPSD